MGYYFLGDLPKFNVTLKVLLTQDHVGLEVSKRYSSYSLILTEPNFIINKAVIREYKVIICFDGLP